jgi:Dolichyl-phosphate-mannose-protein mannosyltransferase
MKPTYFRLASSSRGQYALATLLLLILAAELAFTARRESQTVDEGIHIYAGYRHWCGDYGINPEHPPLAKLVATIPLLFDHPKNPGPACGSDNSDKSGNFAMGRQFLYSNDAGRILTETRSFIGLFPLLLAALVFLAARRMFGGWAGLLAMLLVVFEPTIVGHGTLVTTDLAETCCYFAAVYAFYRYTQQRTNLHLIVSGVTAGLALAAKHSGILLLPALVLLAVADLWLRRRAPRDEMSGRESELKVQLVRQAVALVGIVIIAFVTLWGFYRFRHAPRPHGYEMSESLSAFIQDGVQYRHAHGLMLTRVIPLLAYVLPKSYVYGMADIAIDNSVGRTAYVFGQLYTTGKWFYFPAAILVKATLGFLLLLLLTIPAAGYLWREKKCETLFLLIPAIFFLAVSMTSKLNFGIRHVLPIFPLLIVFAAGAACYLASRNRVWLYAVVLFAAFHCASSLRAFPYSLSYSNEAFGGQQQTYRYLLDTNADWAQGLIDDRDYLARNHITDCWIDYYGPLDPDYYGVPCKVLAVYPSKRAGALPLPFEGTLIVSVADFMGYAWGPPGIDPFGPLHHVQPIARLGGHSLVFQGHFDLPVASAESHSAMAQLLAGEGRMEEALAEARRGVALAPQAMDTHLALAQILVQARQLPMARAEYLESIRLAEVQGEGYWWGSIGPARMGLAQLDAAR